jgi:hypothetical protein
MSAVREGVFYQLSSCKYEESSPQQKSIESRGRSPRRKEEGERSAERYAIEFDEVFK